MKRSVTEGSLEVQLSTIWKNGKAEVGRGKEREEERGSERRKSEKKEEAGVRKGEKG